MTERGLTCKQREDVRFDISLDLQSRFMSGSGTLLNSPTTSVLSLCSTSKLSDPQPESDTVHLQLKEAVLKKHLHEFSNTIVALVAQRSECIQHMWSSMTKRAVGQAVMQYHTEGQEKKNYQIVCESRRFYQVCYNETSSS